LRGRCSGKEKQAQGDGQAAASEKLAIAIQCLAS
jgi:hypothetical protein